MGRYLIWLLYFTLVLFVTVVRGAFVMQKIKRQHEELEAKQASHDLAKRNKKGNHKKKRHFKRNDPYRVQATAWQAHSYRIFLERTTKLFGLMMYLAYKDVGPVLIGLLALIYLLLAYLLLFDSCKESILVDERSKLNGERDNDTAQEREQRIDYASKLLLAIRPVYRHTVKEVIVLFAIVLLLQHFL